jgi:hypothetical protein
VGGIDGIIDGASVDSVGGVEDSCCVDGIDVSTDGDSVGCDVVVVEGDGDNGKEKLCEGAFVVLGDNGDGREVEELVVLGVVWACIIRIPDMTALPITGVISI